MAKTLIFLGVATFWAVGTPVRADDAEIMRWEENGVVSFGDAQAAPPRGTARITRVEVQPANGMDAADTSVLQDRTHPSVMLLGRGGVKNPRGWKGRGYTKPGGDYRGSDFRNNSKYRRY